jgi:hypothetical protein
LKHKSGECASIPLIGTDPWHECSPGEHASRVHHGPFPLHPRRLHRNEPGTLTREAAAHHATAPGLLGWTRVALEPFLPRLADVPGGMGADAHARPLALGGTGCGTPDPTRHTRDDVPPRLRGTVPGGGNRRGFLARSARAHNLAAAHGAGIMTAPPRFKGGTLFVGEMANRERWFHRTAHLIQNTMYPNTLLKMY